MSSPQETSAAEQQPSNGTPLIDIDHLKVFFPIKQGFIVDREVARVHAVNDVTLSINEGETRRAGGGVRLREDDDVPGDHAPDRRHWRTPALPRR